MHEIKVRVAVLLAAYNGIDFIDMQLKSISKQANVDVHIFISVDLSSDRTYEFCEKLASQMKNVTLLDYGQRFGGAAKNFFRLIRDVDFSKYDYVALADQDDIWLENKLLHAITYLESNKYDAFSSDVTAFWSDGRERLVKKSYPQKSYDYYFEAAGPGCTYVFTKKSLEQFKVFLSEHWDEVNQVSLHDWMIYSFYRSRGLKWHIDSLPLMRYRQHENNQVGFNSGFKAAFARLILVKDNWYRHQVNSIYTLINKKDGVSLKLSRWFLITHFWQLRRRPRDAFVLLVMVLLGVF